MQRSHRFSPLGSALASALTKLGCLGDKVAGAQEESAHHEIAFIRASVLVCGTVPGIFVTP